MAASSATRTIATTATALAATSDLSGGYVVIGVPAAATQTVYIGGPNVTTTNGIPLVAGTNLVLDLGGSEDLYGIVAAGTEAIRVLSLGV